MLDKMSWYWMQEFSGNVAGTAAILLSIFTFGGIAIFGSTTFAGLNVIAAIPFLAVWGILAATRLVDDMARGDIMELVGDAVMILGLGWFAMIVGSIASMGHLTFIENNPWILWSEIPVLALLTVVVTHNWIIDIRRFRKRK